MEIMLLVPGPSLFKSHFFSRRNMHSGGSCVSLRQQNVTICASATEPKWKEKLAKADERAEQIRQMTLQAQEDYRKRQLSGQQGNLGDGYSLDSLEFIPYLDEAGLITNCSRAGAKASVYAIFDKDKMIQYIGVSRQVYNSMKLHFARMPTKCFYAKVQHLEKPSKTLLEAIRNKWISSSSPIGNIDHNLLMLWENPLDCKPLMTEEEKQKYETASLGPPQAKVLKDVARRLEKDLFAGYKERKCNEFFRFDPKLKEKGLLDLKNLQNQPDTSVPSTEPNKLAN